MIDNLSSNIKRNKTTNIISIQGGLGNQLFEWAFAQSLIARGTRVVFDTARCRGERPLEIGKLLERQPKMSKPLGLSMAYLVKLRILTEEKTLCNGLSFIKEKGFSHHPEFVEKLSIDTGKNNYVLGYFQSPKYFENHEMHIRNEILKFLNGMLTSAGINFMKKISKDDSSVAIHVRRGDYISNASAAARHGVLQVAYYQDALDVIRDLGKQNIIWFSDDTDWVRENLARAEDTIVTPTLGAQLSQRAGGEIALMAACSSRVIANSSFSWWAGWLGNESTNHSPIIAPKRWFSAGDDGAHDLIPEPWMRL